MPISKMKAKEVRDTSLKIFVISLLFLILIEGIGFSVFPVILLLTPIAAIAAALSFAAAFITHIIYVITVEDAEPVPEEETEVKPGIAMPYGPRAIYELVFPDGRSLRIEGKMFNEFGRSDFKDRIPYNQARLISKKHFAIKAVIDEEGRLRYYIKDIGSRNGTLLNGVDLRDKGWVELKDGDIISPASTVNLVFRVSG